MSILAIAFCGFYVAAGDGKLVNDATQVVLMRNGTRTVLAMQNAYKGPPDAFALVVPVPVVLHEGDVKTLPREVFDHVEQMGAPRLVEYWEQDPCAAPPDEWFAKESKAGTKIGEVPGAPGLGVTVEAKFAVGEYQIVILSAKDSTGLDTWLRKENYQIPADAEPLLRPYVIGGSKFFVAKVDPAKVAFDSDGRAQLSPLRFHYDSDDFALPIRLGLASSAGTQDLIVNILSPHQRYQVANYPNAYVPTNLDVTDAVREHFAAFYAQLFDRTLQVHPGAVITEYAWQASTCDPCPGPRLDAADFATLGADVLDGGKPYRGGDLVLTRLHARYGKTIKDDLQFIVADPISGGREDTRGADGALAQTPQPAPHNSFQARYAIRHPWTGPIRCEHPVRGQWGAPPPELRIAAPATRPATNLAYAPRGGVALADVVAHDVPAIDLHVGPPPPPEPAPAPPPKPGEPPAAKKKTGCGCASGDASGFAVLLAIPLACRTRRPARRRRR